MNTNGLCKEQFFELIRTYGAVYCIGDEGACAVKIGWSSNPFLRLQVLQTANSRKLVLYGVIPGPRGAEAALHEAFQDVRLRGEWFANDDGDVTDTFRALGDRYKAFPMHEGAA